MGDDHLDRETSISAEITPTGVEAKSRSRAVAAFDRLVGNIIEIANAPLEARNSERRATTKVQAEIIAALGKAMVERIGSDEEFAAAAMEAHLDSVALKIENKKHVVRAAIEDLKQNPPTKEQTESGPDKLDEEFTSRFERFAEDATADNLRIKWGKILAAEIRRPGSISRKAMRIVDEIDSDTAFQFEVFCQNRIDNVVPRCISASLSFDQKANFVGAGLIIDPGLTGQVRLFSEVKDSEGTDLWISDYGFAAVAYKKGTSFSNNGDRETAPLVGMQESPGTPAYILTEVGHQIASIFEDKSEQAWAAFLDALATLLAPNEVREYRKTPNGLLQIRLRLKKPEAVSPPTA